MTVNDFFFFVEHFDHHIVIVDASDWESYWESNNISEVCKLFGHCGIFSFSIEVDTVTFYIELPDDMFLSELVG